MFKKKMKLITGSLLILMVASSLPLLGKNKTSKTTATTKTEDDGLARVAILDFINVTQNAAVGWVSSSLPDAVYSSMVKKFEFKRSEKAITQKIANDVLKGLIKDSKRTKSAPKKKPVAQNKSTQYTVKDILLVAKKSNSDMVIYGDFELNAKTEKLKIRAIVYHVMGKKVIGKSVVETAIDGSLFTNIDVIANNIVQDIYKFALALSEANEPKEKKTRVMVLVPTWKSAKEEKKAKSEIALMKKHLSKKYKAKFITLTEFMDEKKVDIAERKGVFQMAAKRLKVPIIKWLEGKGVKDAFIILVENNKVNITPVVNGQTIKETSYSVNAKESEKFGAFDKLSKEFGMTAKRKKGDKITISKKSLKKKKVVTEKPVWSGMLWRNLVAPGWGHIYMGEQMQGYTYLTSFVASTLYASFSIIDENKSNVEYENRILPPPSPLGAPIDDDPNDYYGAWQRTKFDVTTAIFLFGSSYLSTAIDTLFYQVRPHKEKWFNSIWKTLLMPGWGHYAQGDGSGAFFTWSWLTTLSFLASDAFAYQNTNNDYTNTSNPNTFDRYYELANDYYKRQSESLLNVISIYTSSLTDVILKQWQVKHASYLEKIWRSAIIPGWGNSYVHQTRGTIYSTIHNVVLAQLVGSFYTTKQLKEQYLSVTDPTQFDVSYGYYNVNFESQNDLILATIGNYSASLLDVTLSHFDKGNTNLWGMLWRSALIPGWGHIKNDHQRGAFYLAGAMSSLLVGGLSFVRMNIAQENYDSSLANGSSSDISKYEDYQRQQESFQSYATAFIVNYSVSLIDSLITGLFFTSSKPQKLKTNKKLDKVSQWNFNFSATPDINIATTQQPKFNSLKYKLALTKNF